MKYLNIFLLTLFFTVFNLTSLEAQCDAKFSQSRNKLVVSFNSLSWPTSGLPHLWNFGDGNTSTLTNPVHSFATSGIYKVKLIVQTGTCTDSIEMMVAVDTMNCPITLSAHRYYSESNFVRLLSDGSGTNSTTTYKWYFGDGDSSTNKNAVHLYSATPDTHSVSLVATDTSGCKVSATFTRKVLINCSVGPALFKDSVVGLTHYLKAPLVKTNSTYSWYFGDGNSSTLKNPVHTYASSGAFNITFDIHDTVNNCYDSISKLSNCSIKANLTKTLVSGNTYNFSSSGTVGTIPKTQFYWNFGDGSISSQANPTHTYSASGTYPVFLHVLNSNGCWDYEVDTVVVTAGPACSLDAQFTDSISGLTSFFNSSVTGTTGSITYSWLFGDGNSSSLASPTHTYAVNGVYSVRLIVSDSLGCSDTIDRNVSVCSISASFTHSSAGLTTNFNNTSTAGATINYLWNFGDGNTSTAVNPSHTYATAGNYRVTLEVSDTNGGAICHDSLSQVINVIVPCNLIGSFTDSSSGLTSSFTSTVTGATGPIVYIWLFGDGNSGSVANPNHTYASNGVYAVRLIVLDSVGCGDTIDMNVSVCSISASFTHSSTGLTSNFTSTSTSGPSINYLWNFGDGNTSTAVNPSHTYAASGNYRVTLEVRDTTGGGICHDSLSQVITVVATSVSCLLDADFNKTITGLSVAFSSVSTGINGGALFNWQFGDGNTGFGMNTNHIYSSAGIYIVTLTVNDTVCSDTITKTVAVGSNIFSPNGDGIDDVFPNPCSGIIANIYNSTGLLVKTLPVGTTSWDGTNNLGGNAPIGLYYILCAGSSTPISVTLLR